MYTCIYHSFFVVVFVLPKDTFFFFYIAPLLDFYRTGISCFKIDHVSIIRFKLIFKEVFFFCVVCIRFLKSFLISKLIMYHSIHILKVFFFFCSLFYFFFALLKNCLILLFLSFLSLSKKYFPLKII